MSICRTIGVLPGFQAYEGNTISYFLLSVFQGILAAAETYGCHVLLACGMTATLQPDHPCPAWPTGASDTTFVPVGPWNTDGLIAIPPLRSESRSQYLQELLADGFPVVYAGTGESGPSGMADNATGIHQAVAHLWDHGHRRIAYIAGFENVVGDSSIRLDAFRSAMQSYGLEPDSPLIAYGLHSVEGGWSAMQQLLSAPHSFTALVTSNYSSAVGAIQALRAAGRRIPEDIAVIAFDDTLDAIAQTPPVTTVHQQTFEMGYRAVGLLMEYIEGTRRDPVTIQVPGQLVIRRSCGCCPDKTPCTLPQPSQPVTVASTLPQIVQDMANAVLTETEHLHPDEARLSLQLPPLSFTVVSAC